MLTLFDLRLYLVGNGVETFCYACGASPSLEVYTLE